MKANKIITFMLVSLFSCIGIAAIAQPAWVVNANDYTYSMSVTGQLNTDGSLSVDVNDKIGAFINGECRGVTNVKYISANGSYYVFLLIYSNDPTGSVSFKIWDNSGSEEMDAKETMSFSVNGIVGSISSPYLFNGNSLKSEGKLLSFSIPNQSGASQLSGNNVYIQEHWSGNLMGIVPTFTISDGAKAYVNGVEQTSGVTSNDFQTPVTYTIISADHSTTTIYSVQITTANDIPTDILLSNSQKEENDNLLYIGDFRTITDNPAEYHVYSLIDGIGTSNENFVINGIELSSKKAFNFEEHPSYKILVRADDQKGGTVDKFFTIVIDDLNEAPTGVSILNTKIPVSVPANSVVSELLAIDQDAGDTHTFELVAGDGTNDRDNGKFSIDGKNLKSKVDLVFLVAMEYNIYVKTTDKAGQTVTVPVVIKNNNQGSSPTSLKLSNTLIDWIDASQVFVGSMTTDDLDQQTGHIFTLPVNDILGPDNSFFTIKSNNLFLSWTQPVPGKFSYNILLSVADSMGHHFDKVYVIEVKENTDSTKYVLSNSQVIENDPLNTVVGYFYSENKLSSGYTITLPLEVDLKKYCNNDFTLNGKTLLTSKVFDFEKEQSVTIQVEVSNGLSKITQDVTLGVVNKNDAPTGIKTSTQIISEATAVNTVFATLLVEDEDLGDTHKFELILGNGINDEGNPFFKIEGDKLILARPLDFETSEFHNIFVQVTDSLGATFEQGIRLQVTDANDAPVISSKPTNFVVQGEMYIYAIVASDSDGDSISYSFDNLPGWLTYNPASNVLTGFATNEWVGEYTFAIKASDSTKETFQYVSISVINVNDPPEINSFMSHQEFITNQENVIQLPLDLIVDPDAGDELTFSLSMDNNSLLPEWIQFDPVKLTVSGNPPGDAWGEISLRLSATDKLKQKQWIVFKLSVSFPTALPGFESVQKFSVFPNPVQDFLFLNIPEGNEDAQISISNASGQIIKTLVFGAGSQNKISFSENKPGLYLVKFRQGNEEQQEKIIKQ